MFGWIKAKFSKPQPKRVAPVVVTPVDARRPYVSMAPRPMSAPAVAPDTSNDMAYWLLMNQAMQNNTNAGHFAAPAPEPERFTSGGGGDFGGAGTSSSWEAPAPSPSYDSGSSYSSSDSSCSSSDYSSSSSDSSSSCSSSD